jgi:hypothetical protein
MQKTKLSAQPENNVMQTGPQPDILIFKTNVQTAGDRLYLKKFLDQDPLIQQWNIDLEDIDCVLRVVSTHLQFSDIINLLNKRGYYCNELM